MTERVHFVLPQMTPYYGMEKAAALLMAALVERHWDVTATVLSGGIPEVAADLRVDALGIPRSPVRLVRAVPPLRRGLAHLPDDALIVACGLWAAAPVATALLATGRSYIAWEHSVLPLGCRSTSGWRSSSASWTRWTAPGRRRRRIRRRSPCYRVALAGRPGVGRPQHHRGRSATTGSRAASPGTAGRATADDRCLPAVQELPVRRRGDVPLARSLHDAHGR